MVQGDGDRHAYTELCFSKRDVLKRPRGLVGCLRCRVGEKHVAATLQQL